MARYTIEFADDVDRKLDALAVSLGVRTKADVVRKALGLLDYVVSEKALGKKLVIEDEKKNEREVLVTL